MPLLPNGLAWPWDQRHDRVHQAPGGGNAVVAGPSGVGKSSLLNALSSPAAAPAHGPDSHCSTAASGGEDGSEDSGSGGGSSISENGSSSGGGGGGGGRAEWSAFLRGSGGRGMSAPASATAQITIGDEIGDIQVPVACWPPRPAARHIG